MASLGGVEAVAGGLTLNDVHVSGTVPEQQGGVLAGPRGGGGPPGGGGGPSNIDVDSRGVSGVDPSRPSLGAITEGQVSKGSYFSSGSSREAILNTAYARRKDLSIGDTVTVKGRKFKVVGLASPPLGGQASDIYVKLDQLQAISDREGRVNTLYVRADSSEAVAGLSKRIERPSAAPTSPRARISPTA